MRSPLRDVEAEVARRQLRTTVHRLDRGDTFPFPLAGFDRPPTVK
jgi:hypothetical protein